MAHQLPYDCLREILEHFEENKPTLHSCLLVNRLWCKISVIILWRNVWNFKYSSIHPLRVEKSILSTLIACLPNESKELLYKNEIFISTPTSKSPLFNYPAFCKILSIYEICKIVENAGNEPSITINSIKSLQSLKTKNRLVINEIIKMFVKQIPSLRKMIHNCNSYSLSFTYNFPGLEDLSELRCSSNLPSDFFQLLSQTCHKLQTISIAFKDDDYVSKELKELISSQNNLKNLTLSACDASWTNIIPALTNLSNTVTKLRLYDGDCYNLPLSFVSLFSNLQEVIFLFFDGQLEDFKNLQYANFPKLQILKIPFQCPKPEYVIKFLEINGKNLEKFYTGASIKSLSLSIPKLCPNLKSLYIIFNSGEVDILKNIFNNCQYLESIKIWCGRCCLTEKEVFETVARHSLKNFCELKIHNNSNSDFISSEDLELFFISWKNRPQKKLLRLFILIEEDDDLINGDNMKIIKKYENLGIVKFETKSYLKLDEEEELTDYY